MVDMSVISLVTIDAAVVVENLAVRKECVSWSIWSLICVETSGNTNVSHSLADAPESGLLLSIIRNEAGAVTTKFFFSFVCYKVGYFEVSCMLVYMFCEGVDNQSPNMIKTQSPKVNALQTL
jgi:hypothetical protein